MQEMKRLTSQLAVMVTAAAALASFYLFSRFTVDDAFITWRYGRNLVDAGVWGYNATQFDLTQAYTNPLLAVLSILPAALGMDVVLFFKLGALVSLVVPFWWIRRRVQNKHLFAVLYLAFLALPATMIHAFSGLETFLFVALMGMLFIALLRQEFWPALILTLLLVLTRPEAWLLVGLVPAYFLYQALAAANYRLRAANLNTPIIAAAVLGGAFALYALFHYCYFGHVLPNTFYIKATQQHFYPGLIARIVFFLTPTALVLLFTCRPLLVLCTMLAGPMIYNYATSDLQMDYMDRFTYHLFGGAYLLLAYLAATETRTLQWKRYIIAGRSAIAALAFGVLALFAATTMNYDGLIGLTNYYPRILNAHAALGKALAELPARSFALSDAGAAAFHSRLTAFDNNGLGSALVAHAGISQAVIEQYNPDVVVLRADDAGVVLSNEKKKQLFAWAQEKRYRPVCDVYLNPEYRLRIFAAQDIAPLHAVCERSKQANNVKQREFFAQHKQLPPWQFWRE